MENYFPVLEIEELDIDSLKKKKRILKIRRIISNLVLIAYIGAFTAIITEVSLLLIGLSSDQTAVSILVIMYGIPAGILIALINMKKSIFEAFRDSIFSSIICSICFILIHWILRNHRSLLPNFLETMLQTKILFYFIPLIFIVITFPWGAIIGTYLIKLIKRRIQKMKQNKHIH